MIYEQCVKLGENIELPQEEYAIIDQWGEVLQDLRTDPDKCLDRIDWLQNMYSINKTSDKYLRHLLLDIGWQHLEVIMLLLPLGQTHLGEQLDFLSLCHKTQ